MDMKKVKYIGAGIVILLMGIVIFQNFEEKTIRILFAEIRMPIALLLILTFIIGMIAGWIATILVTKKMVTKDGSEWIFSKDLKQKLSYEILP